MATKTQAPAADLHSPFTCSCAGADTVELVVCPRCFGAPLDDVLEPTCRRCLGSLVVAIDSVPPDDRGPLRAITRVMADRRQRRMPPWDPRSAIAPLVEGGQGRAAEQLEDDADSVLVVWALGAMVLVVLALACLLLGGAA